MESVLALKSDPSFIISFAVTIALFVFEQVLVWREKRASNLSFIENKCVPLFSPVIEGIRDLKIKYQKKSITENLIFYQATIFNSGVSDIPASSIYEPLCMTLPSEYKWKSFDIHDKSSGLKITSHCSKNNLTINWDLFKKDEYVRFDAVVGYTGEIKNNDDKKPETERSLSALITFSESRIVNLQVSKRNIRKYENILRWSKTAIYFLLILFSFTALVNPKSTHILHTMQLDTASFSFEFQLNNEGQIVLVDSFGNEHSYDSSFQNFNFHTVRAVQKNNERSWAQHRAAWILGFPFIFFILFEQRRMRKKREKLNLVSPGPWNPYKEEDC